MRIRKERRRQRRKPARFPLMALIASVLGLAVIGFGVWQLTNTGSTAASGGKLGPRLSVNPERVELGNQPFDKMVRAQFELRNTGDQPLTLDASSPVRVLEGC